MSEQDRAISRRSPAKFTEKVTENGHIPQQHRKPLIIALAIVIISDSFGNVLLKYALSGDRAPSAQSLADIPRAALDALTNVWLDLAIMLLVIQFISLIYALRLGPLSLVVPMRGAATYIFTALLAQYVLGEPVTLERWAALAIILVGVTLIGISGGKA